MSSNTKNATVGGCLRPTKLAAAVSRAWGFAPAPLALTIIGKRGKSVRVFERFR